MSLIMLDTVPDIVLVIDSLSPFSQTSTPSLMCTWRRRQNMVHSVWLGGKVICILKRYWLGRSDIYFHCTSKSVVLSQGIHTAPQIYYKNTKVQCVRYPCALDTWLTRPINDNRRQSAFIYGRSYQSNSVKSSSLSTLFAVEAHDERMCVTDLDKSATSDAQSLLACAACLLILVRAYLDKGKRIDW